MQGSNFLKKHLTDFIRKGGRISEFHHNFNDDLFFSNDVTTFSVTFYTNMEFEEQMMRRRRMVVDGDEYIFRDEVTEFSITFYTTVEFVEQTDDIPLFVDTAIADMNRS